MGSHMNTKNLSPRLLTLSLSSLTLILFIYYTTDITAKMTSGPPKIPIRTFDDVIKHDYKVISNVAFSKWVLADAKQGSAKRKVHELYFENKQTENLSFRQGLVKMMNDVINNPKTLYHTFEGYLIPNDPQHKALADQVFALKMDDVIYAPSSLPLQKDSEFLPLFNHHILKCIESGLLRKVYLKYYKDLYVKENFEMTEPEPLRYNNVMFPFIYLGIGIALALVMAVAEIVTMSLKG